MTIAAYAPDLPMPPSMDVPEEVKHELLSIVRLVVFDDLSTYQVADRLKLPPDFVYDVIDGLHDILGIVLANPGKLKAS